MTFPRFLLAAGTCSVIAWGALIACLAHVISPANAIAIGVTAGEGIVISASLATERALRGM